VKRGLILCVLASLVLAGCGSSVASQTASAPAAHVLARWGTFAHVNRPLDVTGPRSDGSLVLAAAGRLWLLRPSGAVRSFAPAYQSPGGEEPYIALATAAHRGCSFGRDTVYAIRLHAGRGVTAITAQGGVRRFAAINAPGLIDGIAFDDTGAFGYRLLVTVSAGSRTTVVAVDCHGSVSTITRSAPRVEGGIAVAPATFGRFAGDLIAPDEQGGGVFAITPRGRTLLVADSGLPHGGDIGVESAAFVPARRNYDALLADRLTPRNRHPGDDLVLSVGAAPLRAAGVRPGDLLVATEGGARTDAIHCTATSCHVLHVADGPAIAHGEGHIAILAR
jgi:hypothetical protein